MNKLMSLVCFLFICCLLVSCDEKCKSKRFSCRDEKVIDDKGTLHRKKYYNGKLQEEYFLLNGLADSTYTAYANGKREYIYNWSEGKKNGLAVNFFENGDTALVQNYKNDSLDGYSYAFYGNGRMKYIQIFKNGACEMCQQYDSIP
jgi:antitoxin component YwqK of YwqJK toxin-antitoxin module